MKSKYVRTIFQNRDTGYCIFVYHTIDNSVPQQARNSFYKGNGYQFTAVGNNLPETDSIEVDLQGKWIRSNHGLQLQIENYEEILPQTEEGIIGYLSSGMIKGIGPKTAERIVEKFGTRTFEIMDQYPDSLLEIKGITKQKLENILVSYQGSHAMRDLAAYLTPFNVTPKKIQKIYEYFGKDALDTVKNQPFMLCRINGFGFLTADEIARANRCRLNDPMRIEGCIFHMFELGKQDGHLFLEKQELQKTVYEQLNKGFTDSVVSELEVHQELYRMVKENQLYYEADALYLPKLYQYEEAAAKKIVSLLLEKKPVNVNMELLIAEAQRDLGILLSEKQALSIKQAFSSLISIITGGPGTGKTTVQKVLIYIQEKLGGKNILLTAPTGRASRRMAESTGRSDAMTMHSALGLTNDEECEATAEMLDADFIIVDEFTMADMRLAYEFLEHIRKGTRVVFVGDVNQLPSVGPGNVFRELVRCGVIPVTVLDMVFRQAENSRIAMNAQKMQENCASLDYGSDFLFISANSSQETANLIMEQYQEAVELAGEENVQILSPFRKRGEVSVDALNKRVWECKGNHDKAYLKMKAGKNYFRIGDRVIHTRNKNQISNGDIGYVRNIYLDEDNIEYAQIEFSEGRFVEYSKEEMEMVEHAFATTVHKSQGGEYRIAIIPWLPMFYKMLRRNILYTAITRAKEKVIIVGSKKAVCMAVHNTESDKRNTRLGERIIKAYHAAVAADEKTESTYEQLVMNL